MGPLRCHSWPRSQQCIPNVQNEAQIPYHGLQCPFPQDPFNSLTVPVLLEKDFISANWNFYFAQNLSVNSDPSAPPPPLAIAPRFSSYLAAHKRMCTHSFHKHVLIHSLLLKRLVLNQSLFLSSWQAQCFSFLALRSQFCTFSWMRTWWKPGPLSITKGEHSQSWNNSMSEHVQTPWNCGPPHLRLRTSKPVLFNMTATRKRGLFKFKWNKIKNSILQSHYLWFKCPYGSWLPHWTVQVGVIITAECCTA